MQPIADLMTDRKRLKLKIMRWRALAVSVPLLLAAAYFADYGRHARSGIGGDYIAQIRIEGVMEDDAERDKMMKEILEDKHAKALLVQFDSPGGTTVGGEVIYLQLKEIAKQKPVVGVMHTLCASACFMASLGTDHVIAREGTLTGSIGVLLQSVEVSRLADKLGITPITITSGPMKDVPSMTAPFTEEQRKIVSQIISDAYDHFVELIVDRRKMDNAQVRALADGRVYTGRQALKLNLIDGIGGTDEALDWLEKNKKISSALDLREVKPHPEFESLFEQMSQATGLKIFSKNSLGLDGLVSIWHPSAL